MKVVMNVWKSKTGLYRHLVPDSNEEKWCKENMYKLLGTKTDEIEPPMREVEKEAEIILFMGDDHRKYVANSAPMPPDSYDHKLLYKVKEPV